MKLKNLTLYIISTIIAFALIFTILSNYFEGVKNTDTSFSLNTYTTISVYGKNSKDAVQKASAAITDVENQFSAYITTSEVSKINSIQKKDTKIAVSNELFNIIKTAYKYHEQSGGLFDITLKPVSDLWSISSRPRVPTKNEVDDALLNTGFKNIVLNEDDKTICFLKDNMQLDLGAIAKGYAADIITREILNSGCKKAIIDLGGNISVIGNNNSAFDNMLNKFFNQNISKPWRVGIQKPFSQSGSLCAVINVSCTQDTSKSIVTSGAYERCFEQDGILYHHIIDPKTGYPFSSVADSVTIIGESSMDADALSTSAFMMDISDALSLVKNCGYDAVIIDKNKKIHTTLDKSSVEIVDSSYSFAN